MKKKVKKYTKDMLTVGVAGVGLGIAGGVAGEAGAASTSTAIGTMTKTAIPIAATALTVKFVADTLTPLGKKKKGKKWGI